MQQTFVYTALPARVVFGSGTLASLPDEVRRLGCRRALVLSTPEQASAAHRLTTILGPHAVGAFAEATMHTPVDVTERALAATRAADADCLIAFGGGSTIGLAKAIALRTDLPQIAVPTTYAGSETTPILGETENGRKTTQRSLKVLPEVIVYDVELTMTLSLHMSATSGLNAIAHAVEALYARDTNPVISMLAQAGIGHIADALPRLAANPRDGAARSDALFGAWACGTCLGAVGMALHHKLCHTLGGTFDLPHAATHAIILPHAAAYNAAAVPEVMDRVARALKVEDAAGGLFDLAASLGIPLSLAEIGMRETDLERAAELALESAYWNPRLVDLAGVRRLLDNAFYGRRPTRADGGAP